jgi:hypothetical protein
VKCGLTSRNFSEGDRFVLTRKSFRAQIGAPFANELALGKRLDEFAILQRAVPGIVRRKCLQRDNLEFLNVLLSAQLDFLLQNCGILHQSNLQ